MTTPIERAYVDRGDGLLEGLTCAMVAERRACRDIPEIFVPVAVAPGSVGWGAPDVDRVPLRRP